MEVKRLRSILQEVKDGQIDIEGAMEKLKYLPFEDIGYAKLDNHRALRNGYPEVIYCQGKAVDHIKGIVKRMMRKRR